MYATCLSIITILFPPIKQAKKYQINKGWAQLEGATAAEQKAAFERLRYGFAATRWVFDYLFVYILGSWVCACRVVGGSCVYD